MILFKCDKCQNTFLPNRLFLEGKILERKSFMLPVKSKEPIITEQSIQQLIHLCPTCVSQFQAWLKEEKK